LASRRWGTRWLVNVDVISAPSRRYRTPECQRRPKRASIIRLASARISSELLFSRLKGLSANARGEPDEKIDALQPFPTELTSIRYPLYSIVVIVCVCDIASARSSPDSDGNGDCPGKVRPGNRKALEITKARRCNYPQPHNYERWSAGGKDTQGGQPPRPHVSGVHAFDHLRNR